ncbi:MAG: plasmid pRiA4b ORF-3 family protein [Bacilli bacterium]|nr:plasmid pRiA4b ORF-3 family protein [Bacilli bacterium]
MNIEMNINLDGFEKEINRVITVNDDISLKDFCEAIIESMNGLLEHLYILTHDKINYMSNGFDARRFDEEPIGEKQLSYLKLKENDKMNLEYDTGDGWNFNIEVTKISEGKKEKTFTVLEGKGKGIIENCGGQWGLDQFIKGTADKDMTEWYLEIFETDKLYDINDFNLKKLNNYLDSTYNK